MTIQSERISQTALEINLTGRLDTATAPLLERKIKQVGDEITEMTLNFEKLSYISSMGLRVLLQAQKTLHAAGRKLIIKNMNASIREVFEITGFIKLLVQEEKFVVIRKEEGDGVTLCLIGQMDTENVQGLTRELTAITAARHADTAPVLLTLDARQLSHLSDTAAQQLRQTLEQTAWENRTLRIINASKDITPVLTAAGIGSIGTIEP
jgi:anti-sigma B factor antagonist